MKKFGIAAVLLLALALIAPWGVGQLAKRRVNDGLDQLIEAAPYLGIVERKYTPGWFRSEMEVTFEVRSPAMGALNPAAALIESMKHAGAAGEPPRQEAPAAEAPAADAPAPLSPMVRFTVRNEILHGPVLGLSGVGLARIHSWLVLDENVRQEIVDVFGTDEPLRVSTRVGFFGGAVTSFSSDAHTVKIKGDSTELSWDDLDLDVGYSRNLDTFDVSGDWPRLEIKDAKEGIQFLMRDMNLESRARRKKGDLYDSDLKFSIAEVRIVGADKTRTGISDFRYTVATGDDGDFTSVAVRVGSGAIESAELGALGLDVQAFHNDITLRRLHTATLVRLLAALRDSYEKPASAIAASAAVLDPIKEQGLELFKHDPEFVIDRIGIETPLGAGYLKGVIRLKGVTEKDLKMGALSLIARIDAELSFEAPQKMLDAIQGGPAAVGIAVDEGYAERKADKVVSKLEFHQGELKINGKAQGIPGLGTHGPAPRTSE